MFLFVFACGLVFALFFAGYEAFIVTVGSPRSLKPWVAAGGREAIPVFAKNVRPRFLVIFWFSENLANFGRFEIVKI